MPGKALHLHLDEALARVAQMGGGVAGRVTVEIIGMLLLEDKQLELDLVRYRRLEHLYRVLPFSSCKAVLHLQISLARQE